MRKRYGIALAAWALASLVISGDAMAQRAGTADRGTTTQQESQMNGGQMTKQDLLFQSSTLSDLDVFNDRNEKLGNLDNLVIDAGTGQVLYGVVSTGFIAGKTIAVPWSAFRFGKQNDEHVLLLNMTQEKLTGAPTFDSDNMANLTDTQWTKTVNDYFGVRTAARPIEGQHHQH
ncbi:MAG: PRC-barrel domain-containing protein [Thermoguttaceae bacterium]